MFNSSLEQLEHLQKRITQKFGTNFGKTEKKIFLGWSWGILLVLVSTWDTVVQAREEAAEVGRPTFGNYKS